MFHYSHLLMAVFNRCPFGRCLQLQQPLLPHRVVISDRTARPRPHAVGTVSEKHLLIPRDSDILVSFQMHIELSPMDLDISSNLKFSNVRRTFFFWYSDIWVSLKFKTNVGISQALLKTFMVCTVKLKQFLLNLESLND